MPVSVAEPAGVAEFWRGWLAWAEDNHIDYAIGRRLPSMLAALGLRNVEATAETALYCGGSPRADYWARTAVELRDQLIGSGHLDDRTVDTFLAQCADQRWWTQTIAFTAVRARSVA